MTVHLVTFSDSSMSRSRELCATSAAMHGVNFMNEAEWELIKANWAFRHLSESVLYSPRGPAFWSWKPYVISAAMDRLPNGDILIYADAGVEFINNVSHIIERMDQDIFLFGNQWPHYAWCKRDVAEAIWPCNGESRCPSPHYEFWDKFGKQCQASVIFFKVTDYSKQFVAEWLKWCLFEGGRLIDDSPSRTPNHPEFRENRHDQAILTTMAYREGIKLHWWPAVYNRFNGPGFVYEKGEYVDTYPPLVHHHRLRDNEWSLVNAA